MDNIISQLIGTGLTFQEYLLLYCLSKDNYDKLYKYHKIEPYSNFCIEKLANKNYIRLSITTQNNISYLDHFYNMNLELTQKGRLVLIQTEASTPSNDRILPMYKIPWIEEYYNLFPKGVKSGGFYVRTSIVDCSNKMFKFLKDNPQFTKDIVLAATKNYIKDCELRHYDKMKLAPYFITKEGTSMLSGYCEAYVQGINNNQDTYNEIDSI